MENKTKIIQNLIYFFLSILTLNFVFIYFFKEWRFTKPLFNNLFWALHFCSMLSLIIFFIILKKENLKIGLSIFLAFLWIIIFYGQFNPIDTYEYPHDKKVVLENDNVKTVITEAKSGKTNEIKIDTIKVIDKFIFRKILIK